jgi:phospholipase/carboxylesterase
MTPSWDLAMSGAPLARAKAVAVLLHGRGATADSMLALAEVLAQPDFAYIAPQAPGGSWYPYSFMDPIEQNEPHLSRSLATVRNLLGTLSAQGFGAHRVVLLGFSQGGCLALEYAARNARRYGGVIGLSAGLIGPQGAPRDHIGSLDGTRVFVGCSDIDAHIPLSRVQETSRTLRRLGGDVVERIYPGMGHIINDDEVHHVRGILADLFYPTTPAERIIAS